MPFPPFPPLFVANDFTGTDLGDQINKALTSATGLNGKPGEVLVLDTTFTGTPHGSIVTPVVIGQQQTVRFGPGNFAQSASITLQGRGARVTGAGATSTWLTNTSSTAASVILDPGTLAANQYSGMEVSDLLLYRNTGLTNGVPNVPAASAVGIDASVRNLGGAPGAKTTLEQVRIRGVQVLGTDAAKNAQGAYITGYSHYHGIALGPTLESRVDRCVVQNSYYDNIRLQNAPNVFNVSAQDGYVCQWQLSDLSLLGSITGSGLFAITTAPASGTAQMVLGTWTNVSTNANKDYGLRVVGVSTASINDLRVFGGFFGGDTQSEIYLDTYGAYHSIRDAFIEYAGNVKGAQTANNSNGIEITANNPVGVNVTGCLITSCNSNGILTSSPNTVVTGCDILNNGQNASSGVGRIGVYVAAGAAELVGNRLGNVGPTTQQYGIFCSPGSNVTVTGNRLHDNGVYGVDCIAGSNVTVTGNRLQYTPPAGGIGGTPGASAGNL